MWPIQLASLSFIVRSTFLFSSTLCNTSSILARPVQLIFSILLHYHISKLSTYFWSVQFQHHTQLYSKCSTVLVSSLNLSPITHYRKLNYGEVMGHACGQHAYLVSLPSLFFKAGRRKFQESSVFRGSTETKPSSHHTHTHTHIHTEKFAFVQLTHVKNTTDRALRIFSWDKMSSFRIPEPLVEKERN